jgi:hypothetical protein
MVALPDDPNVTYISRAEDDPSGDEDAPSIDVEDLDLEALAEELVKLFKRELRLENERRGWHRVC